MKFHPAPIIRYFYRYFFVALYILFPLYIMLGLPLNSTMTKKEDQVIWFLLGLVLFFAGSLVIHFAFWEKFFATLEIKDERIVWRCPFRKTQSMSLDDCVVIGACTEHTKKGIPSECIYFSSVAMPMINTELPGALMRSQNLIKYTYSNRLCDYLVQKVPDKRTRILGSYRWRRSK